MKRKTLERVLALIVMITGVCVIAMTLGKRKKYANPRQEEDDDMWDDDFFEDEWSYVKI